MTTHTDLIARLREMEGRLRLEAADAIEALEQQVAALTSAVKDAEVVCDSYAAENQRLSDEKDALRSDRDSQQRVCIAAQAREAKLMDALKDYDNQASEYDGRTSKELGDRIKSLLALPTDSSALMERLKEERAKVLQEIQDAKN